MTEGELAPATKVIYAYDAFVSYNSRDREVVDTLCRLLEEHAGLSLWKDDWELTGGQDWIEALPEGINRCRSLIAFVGANGIGPWHKEEIKVAMRKGVESGAMKVIPALLPGAPDRPDLPEFLRSRHCVDIRHVTPWTIRLLRCAITDERPGPRDEAEDSATIDFATIPKRSRVAVLEWSVANMRTQYELLFRLANVEGPETAVVKTFYVRTLDRKSTRLNSS